MQRFFMKKVFYLILSIALFSCQGEKKEAEKVSDPEKTSESEDQSIHIRNFSLQSKTINQKLSLEWNSEEKVTYILEFKNDTCEPELTGTAIVDLEKASKRSHRGISKKSYISFFDKKEKLTVIIHLESEDKDHGIASLIYNDPSNNCQPSSNPMFEIATE